MWETMKAKFGARDTSAFHKEVYLFTPAYRDIFIISRISAFILCGGITEFWSSEIQTFSVFIEEIVLEVKLI